MRAGITKRSIYWAFFFFAAAAALLAMQFVGIYAQSILFLLVVLVIVKGTEVDGLSHPLSWFPIFYYLYSVSYPLYYVIDNDVNPDIHLLIPLCFSGLIAFVVGVLLFSSRPPGVPRISLSPRLLEVFCWVSLTVCALLILYVIASGVTSKREFLNLVRAGGLDVAFNFFPFATIVYILRLMVLSQSKTDFGFRKDVFDRLGMAMLAVFMVGYGVTGERDFVFRLAFLIMVVIFAARYKYKFKYLLLAVSALILILPFSQAAKAYLISGGIQYEGYRTGDIFNTEFASAGRNTYYVISRDLTGYAGETIIWDIKRYLNFIFPDQQSTGVWFNDYIRYSFGDHGTSGWGFSIVAEGYMNFGLWGPAALFFMIGVVSGLLYRRSGRNGFYYALYLLYIPTLIYVVRADLANYLSLAFKVNIIMVALVYVSAYLAGRIGSRNQMARGVW